MPSAPKRKVLVTGAAGFIGSRLVTGLQARGHEAAGAQFDLLDCPAAEAVLREKRWDVVIHLAAISHVPTCEKDPGLAYRTNVGGTAVLLEAMRRAAHGARVIFSSTAQVYQAPADFERGKAILMDETRAILPQNTYARTKWQGELLLQDVAQREGLPVTVLRLFNHTHKSQSPDFFLPHLYHAILAQAQLPGLHEGTVSVGNLELSRDIGSIQDLLDAFVTLVERPSPPPSGVETFNICSGTPKRLSKLAHGLAERLGGGKKINFLTDPARVRPGEPETIQGSHERFSAATGWRPHCVDETQLLDRFLEE